MFLFFFLPCPIAFPEENIRCQTRDSFDGQIAKDAEIFNLQKCLNHASYSLNKNRIKLKCSYSTQSSSEEMKKFCVLDTNQYNTQRNDCTYNLFFEKNGTFDFSAEYSGTNEPFIALAKSKIRNKVIEAINNNLSSEDEFIYFFRQVLLPLLDPETFARNGFKNYLHENFSSEKSVLLKGPFKFAQGKSSNIAGLKHAAQEAPSSPVSQREDLATLESMNSLIAKYSNPKWTSHLEKKGVLPNLDDILAFQSGHLDSNAQKKLLSFVEKYPPLETLSPDSEKEKITLISHLLILRHTLLFKFALGHAPKLELELDKEYFLRSVAEPLTCTICRGAATDFKLGPPLDFQRNLEKTSSYRAHCLPCIDLLATARGTANEEGFNRAAYSEECRLCKDDISYAQKDAEQKKILPVIKKLMDLYCFEKATILKTGLDNFMGKYFIPYSQFIQNQSDNNKNLDDSGRKLIGDEKSTPMKMNGIMPSTEVQ